MGMSVVRGRPKIADNITMLLSVCLLLGARLNTNQFTEKEQPAILSTVASRLVVLLVYRSSLIIPKMLRGWTLFKRLILLITETGYVWNIPL